jgi:NAD(P)-dependent dehydrogenase (short-subunit alcohol dehydrogenase family)
LTVGGPMAGRVCVVTGATRGIGFVTARELARKGATVVAVGRDPRLTAEVTERIAVSAGNRRVRGKVADLLIQSEVRRLATELRSDYPGLHVLVNNAGAVFAHRELTVDGVERTWALNVVAPFLLTQLLLERLRDGAPARVVNVASASHRGVQLRFDDLGGVRHYSGYGAYSRSKLALILMTYEFARRQNDGRVTFNALHPGLVATQFGRNNPGAYGTAFAALLFVLGIRPNRGARTSVFLASDPSVQRVTGKYFHSNRTVASSRASYDGASGARLWNVLTAQSGISSDVLSRTG